MNQDVTEDEILADVQGALAIVTLNRPKALNALSLGMIRKITALLMEWQGRDEIKRVLFVGTGERAFCAGGDVKSLYYSGLEYRRGSVSGREPAQFFGEEYRLNKQIFHYPKPIIAFMNGLTMGGGYGIAGNAKYRIASEKTIFAMPEVGIGFFPDVGSMYHLTRAKDNMGRYLAMTGSSIGGADMVHFGLADYFIECIHLSSLIDGLKKKDEVESAIMAHETPSSVLVPEQYSDVLSRAFRESEPRAVIDVLQSMKGGFAREVLGLIEARSPTSVAVAAAYYERAKDMDFDEVMEMDFTVMQRFLETPDLYEGIRAQLIDKDRDPKWSPQRLGELDVADINGYFTSTAYTLEDVQIFKA